MISRWDPVVYPLSHGDGVVSMIVTISFRCERCGCYDFVMLDSAYCEAFVRAVDSSQGGDSDGSSMPWPAR